MPDDRDTQRKVPRKKRVARFIARAGVLAIVAAWVIQEGWGETAWWAVFITYAPPVVYLAIPAAAGGIAVLACDAKAFLWALGAGVLCLLTVAMPSINLAPPPGDPEATIRVVTWNIHGEAGRLSDMQAFIADLDPDILCVQEAGGARFDELLMGASIARSGPVAILTRGTVEEAGALEHGVDDEPALRKPVVADISLPQGDVTVMCVHLYSYQLARTLEHPGRTEARRLAKRAVELRTGQVDAAMAWLDEQRGPTIIAGDFNTPPRGRIYDSLRERLTDCFAAVGNGFGWSFSRERPMIRIDYVWLSPDLTPLRCDTLSPEISDHRPIVVDIALAD